MQISSQVEQDNILTVVCYCTSLPAFIQLKVLLLIFFSDLSIQAYMEYFRLHFKDESVTPKMHLLEYHAVPFIRKWRVGLGFHGEQGGESVHARINAIRRDVRGLHDELATLQSVMKTHWIQTRPGAQ